jgi:Domain of unknown function (DUF4412)
VAPKDVNTSAMRPKGSENVRCSRFMQARQIAPFVFAAFLMPACKKGFGSGFEGEITMHTVPTSGPTKDMVVKTKGDKLRFDMNGASGATHGIYDPATNKVTMVIDAQKSYMDLDFNKAGTPQANTTADTAAIDKTGKHETIAGIDCENWVAKDPSGKRSEVCIAQGIAFFDMTAVKAGGPTGLGKELRDKKLFPLRSVEYDASGKELSRMEVTKVEKKSIDDAEFVVPADYKKMSLP